MRLAHRYELGERLGVGGLGTTYRARDRLLDMDVALKVVRAADPRRLGADPVAQQDSLGGAFGAPAHIAPLKSEFVALKTSRHPRLLHVLDFGFSRVDDDASPIAYFSSELVEGDDLSTYAKGRTFEDLARPIGHALSALGFLHARRILHGDVHPKNVLVTRAGDGVLIDLSCVARLDGARLDHLSGTPGFLAPERLRGEASVRAELFAVGKALAVLERQLRSALPPHVQDAVARLIDTDPTRRPANVEETAALLRIELEPWSRLSGAFVGRANETLSFESMLLQLKAKTPGPRVLAYTGPEGVGLTRLLDELKTIAQLSVPVVVETSANTTAPVRALLESVGATDLSSKQAVLRALDDLASRDEPTIFLVDDADLLSGIDRDWLTTLARAIPSDGKVALILSGRTVCDGPTSKEVKVRPLDAADLEIWLVDAPRHVIPSILAATGGIPREVDTLANLLETRGWDSRTTERAAIDVAAQSAPIAGGATFPERRALALLVASGGQLDRKAAAHLSVVQLFRGAVLAPLVVEEAAGFRFHRRSQALRVRLSDSEVTKAHLELAELLRGDPEPTRSLSLRARHLLRGGALEEGASVFREALRAHLGLALVPAADAIVEASPPAPLDLLLEAAAVYESAGDARRSLNVLTHVLRARPDPVARARLRRIAGGCYARLGDSRRAIRSLRLALAAPEPGQRAGVAADLSLALLKKGDHEDAERVVREALATEPPTQASIDLAINGAFAASYRGDTLTARGYLERARNAIQERLPNLGKVVGPRHDYRLRNATAFVSYRAGAVSSALEAYAEALEIAESAGLDDLLAPAALNVGTAAHQIGDLARAISAYARGQRAALAFGMPTTELMLALNSARGWLDAGQFTRARLGARDTFARAEREGAPFVAAAALCTAGEGALLDGDGGEGRTFTSQACDRFVVLGAKREALEAKMVLATIDLAAGASSAAEQSLRQLQPEIEEVDAGDLRARWCLLLAECQMRALRGAEAVALLEKARALARESGRRLLIAEVALALSAAYLAQGATELATTLRRSGRGEVERTSSMLPPDLRASFEAHPTWRPLFSAEREREPPAERGTTTGRIEAADLERLFEITRRLNSAASTEAILEEAMDAAISLTHAERGFLLLPEPDKPRAVRVAVARNLDRERLRSGTMKFSRTIAERVLRTGEPVVATDASIDPRFSRARSVHALGLKSVLSVPIRSKDRILGAIYVDHRFHPDSFSGNEVKLAGLLADQAALVLGRAQLIDELRRKTADLERKSAEVEELARVQAVELVRLNESSTARETRRALRYDYGALVANSPSMRRVLEVLDRVIAADVTVLIQGESGTGKERIARAIHENGARAGKPFVAINCGALPEALLEGELFGYRKGAFSGAARDHDGLFVAAHGGTLFLDELGEMPASMQVKLLRALQQREIRPLGSNESVIVDVRVVAATNRKLVDETRAGRFREDLYYRIAVVEISLPPLRERFEDILPLASSILERIAVEHSRPRASLDRSAERALLKQSWPGNVRQLENVLTKAFLLAGTARIGEEDLELDTTDVSRSERSRRPRDVTRAEMVTALDATGWNVVEAARKLAVPRATFYRMLRRFELRRHDP